MSQRIDKSWLVFASIENFEHDRFLDFSRDRTVIGDLAVFLASEATDSSLTQELHALHQ